MSFNFMVGEPYNQAAFSPSLERERKEKKRMETFIPWMIRLRSRGLLSPQGHPSPSGQRQSETRVPTALASSPSLICLLRTCQKHSGGSRTPGLERGPQILVQVRLLHLWKVPWLDPSPAGPRASLFRVAQHAFQGCCFQPGIL